MSDNVRYMAAVASVLLLSLVWFVVRRHSSMSKLMEHQAPLTVETQAGAADVFDQINLPTQQTSSAYSIVRRDPDQVAAGAEVDTLLHNIESDVIDERAVTAAWKAAASDAAIDVGSDSILKAIAAAERDLQIGESDAPGGTGSVIDTAFDDDVMTVPNAPATHH